LRIGNLFIGLPPGQKDPNGSRWQIASQHHITKVGEYPGIPGRIKSDWMGAYFWNRWADDPGLRSQDLSCAAANAKSLTGKALAR
jgi:hypothetical protein